MITTLLPVLLTLLPPVIIVSFLYYVIKNSNNYEKMVLNFIGRNLVSSTAQEFFEQDKFKNFRNLVETGETIAAANEYKEQMNAPLTESRLAVKITKNIFK